MTFRELLEADREKIKVQLESANTREQAITVLEREMDRLLMQYGEQEKEADDARRDSAFRLIQAQKSILPLIDSNADIQVYERVTDPGKRAGKLQSIVMAAVGLGLVVFGFALTGMKAGVLGRIAAGLLTAAGVGGVGYGGFTLGGGKAIPEKKEQILEATLDGESIYQTLLAGVTVMDHCLDETAASRQITGPVAASSGAQEVTDPEMEFLAGMLETLYGEAGSNAASGTAREMISQIRFYLHKKGIEAVDYSKDWAKAFDRMPSGTTRTLRPALLRGETVVKRGLAGMKGGTILR